MDEKSFKQTGESTINNVSCIDKLVDVTQKNDHYKCKRM